MVNTRILRIEVNVVSSFKLQCLVVPRNIIVKVSSILVQQNLRHDM